VPWEKKKNIILLKAAREDAALIQAVIFNLDGVLVSTDACHYEAWKRLAYEQGIPFTADTFRAIAGMKRMDSLRTLLKKAERTYSPMELWALSARKNDLFNSMVPTLGPENIAPGAVETVSRLRAMGIKTAVGSSSENAVNILRQLKLLPYFDAVVDGQETENGKPDPEVFLLAARKLRVPTRECLVIENTAAGLEAARQAGMKALALGDAAAKAPDAYYPEGLKDFDLPAMLREGNESCFSEA
jgi:beta-phosphoglucomutase